MVEVKFKSFSSGSCGNCYWLGIVRDGVVTDSVLVDSGISVRRLKKYMEDDHLPLSSVRAVLVTHDHNDHIRHLGSFCKHLGIPVYATSLLHSSLAHHYLTRDWIGSCRKNLQEGDWTVIADGEIAVRHFVVPHDATQTVGYAIVIAGHRFVIMTDIGDMTPEALAYARNADTLVIESNFDVDMLMSGPYPHDLKMRICKGHGHLSNDKCADALVKVYHEGMKHIFLCHLSEHNNTPQRAVSVSKSTLETAGVTPASLSALPREHPSPLYTLHQQNNADLTY